MLRSAVNRNPIRMQQNNEVLEQLDLGEELGDCELMISEKLSVFYGQHSLHAAARALLLRDSRCSP